MIADYLKAGYPALLVRTHEPERFIGAAVREANGRTPYQWEVVRGYRQMKEFEGNPVYVFQAVDDVDPKRVDEIETALFE